MTQPQKPSLVPFRERLTCTIEEAACALGIGRSKLYLLIAAGRVQTVKIDPGQWGRRLVKVASLLRLVGEPETAAASDASHQKKEIDRFFRN